MALWPRLETMAREDEDDGNTRAGAADMTPGNDVHDLTPTIGWQSGDDDRLAGVLGVSVFATGAPPELRAGGRGDVAAVCDDAGVDLPGRKTDGGVGWVARVFFANDAGGPGSGGTALCSLRFPERPHTADWAGAK